MVRANKKVTTIPAVADVTTTPAVPATATAAAATKRKAPKRLGAQALRDIKKYQKHTGLLIQKQPFQRLVREITKEISPNARLQGATLVALQESAEAFVADVFRDTNRNAIHANRVTVNETDMTLALQQRRDPCMANHLFRLAHPVAAPVTAAPAPVADATPVAATTA